MSLRFRINLVIALSMIVIVLVGAIFTLYNARKSVREVMDDSMNLAIQSIEDGVSDPLAMKNPAKFWQSRMGLSAGTQRLRMRIILPDGRAIEYMGAWALQPTSPAPSWFVWAIKPDVLIKNTLIETDIGPIRVAIRGNPTDEIAKLWKSAQALFGLIFLQALLVGVLVHLTLNKALRSVPIILKGLENIKTGKFNERLPSFNVPEFSRISDAFNHATSALEQAHHENRALTSRTLRVQEEERRSLARELHDELGQSLTGIKITATSMLKENSTNQKAIESILSICDHLFLVVRSMMRRLRPTVLDDLGLAASLEDMIGNWREQNSHTNVRLQCENTVESCDEAVKIHLYRIVQEALNNIARHARAQEVEVKLKQTNCDELSQHTGQINGITDCIHLAVTDNGQGFDADQVAPGFGLLGIRERAESLGGKFWSHSQPGHGVSIEVEVPFESTSKWQLP